MFLDVILRSPAKGGAMKNPIGILAAEILRGACPACPELAAGSVAAGSKAKGSE
jgi:hypothetical protein